MCLHLHSCSFNDMACLRASAVRDLERNLSHTMGNGWPSKLFNPQSHQRLGLCEKPVEIIKKTSVVAISLNLSSRPPQRSMLVQLNRLTGWSITSEDQQVVVIRAVTVADQVQRR